MCTGSLSDDELEKGAFICGERGGLSASLFFELLLKSEFMVKSFDKLGRRVEVDGFRSVEVAGILKFTLLSTEFRKAVVGGVNVIIETPQGHVLQGFHKGDVEVVVGALGSVHRFHVGLVDLKGDGGVFAAVAVVCVLVVDLTFGFVVRFFGPDRGLGAETLGKFWVDFPT